MIDTVRFGVLSLKGAPSYCEMISWLKGHCYAVSMERCGAYIEGEFRTSEGVMLPTGSIFLHKLGGWWIEFSVGTFLYRHNAYQLSPKEAEDGIRLYLQLLKERIPFVDITTAIAIRVDVYLQWRIAGDYDQSKLPFLLGQAGRRESFHVYDRGMSSWVKHSKNHSVHLYDKTLSVQKEFNNSPYGMILSDMPASVKRLEVLLRENKDFLRLPLQLRQKKPSRKNTVSPLRKSGILVSMENCIPIDGSPIFNWCKIIEVLQGEWPGMYLGPALNAADQICHCTGNGCTSLVLHEKPHLWLDYLALKGANKHHAIAAIRKYQIIGPHESLMAVPNFNQLLSAFAEPLSRYYVLQVESQSTTLGADSEDVCSAKEVA